MHHPQLASYVRSHRKKTGLSQNDLARILDLDEAQVSRHERAGASPPLAIVLSYEAVFGVPVRELYPRLFDEVKRGIEERIAILESELQQRSANGREANAIARKLEWCCERKNQTIQLA